MTNLRYTDLLMDQKFIRWQLASDESLNSYWEDHMARDPKLKFEISKAVDYLKNEGLNKSSLSSPEREEILIKVLNSVQKNNVKIRKRRILFSITASVASVLLIIVFTKFFTGKDSFEKDSTENIIVGEQLSNEDVQLITSNNTISFEDDIEVSLDEKGTAQIMQKDRETKIIDINKDVFSSLIIPYGKRSNIILADGSKVWLNSGTILEFPAQFDKKERVIKLKSGEIYIEVAKDRSKPFFVETPEYKIEVLGTTFNVSSYENSNSTVVLVEGNVSLYKNGDNRGLSLQPNELAEFNVQSNTFIKSEVDVLDYTSWKDGYLTLNKTPMTEVLKQIGRYYNLSFNFDQDVKLQMRTSTGKIHLSNNLENVMTTISLLTSTTYEIENNRIYITNEN